jgi:hypothetical protein
MFAGAIVGAAVALATASGASAAEPKCGLSNGKAATGQPIEIGAVVGKTGRPTLAVRRKRPPLTSPA